MGAKRQYLGTTEIRDDYWTGGKNSRELKLNETYLYAEIDLANEMIGISTTFSEAQKEYNKQDLMYLCLVAIERAGSDYSKLDTFGNVIGNMCAEGLVYRNYTSIEEENMNLDNLIEQMERRASVGEIGQNKEFSEWFDENVLSINCYRNPDGSVTFDRPVMDGLGATMTNDELSIKAKECGSYLLYLVNDANDVYDGCVNEREMRLKLLNENNYLEWLSSSNTNMTRNSILANSKAGIIRDFGASPKDALDTIKQGGVNGLGDPITLSVGAIVGIIVSVLAAVFSFVAQLISDAKEREIARLALEYENSAPSDDVIKSSAPDTGDYGHAKIAELEKRMSDAKSKSSIYETISKPAFIVGIVAVFTAIFGAAIYSSRKKKNS